MKALFIAEKPLASKACREVYRKYGVAGYQIDFLAARGHLVEMKRPDGQNPLWEKWELDSLPMIPDPFLYQPIKSSMRAFDEIKKPSILENTTY